MKFSIYQGYEKYLQPGVIWAVIILGLFLLCAIFPAAISGNENSKRYKPFLYPTSDHILGTDDVGHDIFSVVVYSARVSLIIAFSAGFISVMIGLVIGLAAGYFSGIIDDLLMGLTDLVLIVPKIPVIILIAAITRPSILLLILVLGFLSWETTARMVRSRVMQVTGSGFILSSKTFGFSPGWIMTRDIVPVLYPVILPKLMIVVAGALISEASLSFLGLSDPTMNSWGKMIADAFSHGGFIRNMWWWYGPPAICIILMILACVRIGSIWETKQTERAFD
ncbi:ABC transporter permease [Methanospirillum lacunae]|uniref:ABC transporter permease n=1 Tax=Methanospirillum lacunae TaxID=668570 RepID=A0A2V2N2F0_9EURY|nr:ABC transporter permease [Methanospirillum lacunae]PWR74464.1 ABC transporter permease [Methanospirillum lacunae]